MPIPNTYPTTNSVTVNVEFRNPLTKALYDPSVVQLKYRTPADGTITTRTYSVSGITKDAVGQYHALITVNAIGRWYYTWIGDSARLESYFNAIPSFFA